MSREQLFELAGNGPLVKLAKLVGSGEDFAVTDEHGKTALMNAAENDQYRIVAVLSDKKYNSDVNATDNNGKTALMYACENGSEKAVGLLVGGKYDVDVAATDNQGHTALSLAEASGDGKTLKLMKKALAG